MNFDTEHAAIRFATAEQRFTRGELYKAHKFKQWDELRRKIIPILEELPVQEEQKRHIPDAADYLIDWYERAGHARAVDGGREAVREQIRVLGELALSMVELVNSMHRDTLATLAGLDKSPEAAVDELTIIAADLYYRALTGMKCLTSHTSERAEVDWKKVHKKRARQVTIAARHIYQDLTGKAATISVKARRMRGVAGGVGHKGEGPALRFISAIYDVFEIKASPEAQLAAITKPKKSPSADVASKERRIVKPSRKLLTA